MILWEIPLNNKHFRHTKATHLFDMERERSSMSVYLCMDRKYLSYLKYVVLRNGICAH